MRKYCLEAGGYCPTTDQCNHRGLCLASPKEVKEAFIAGRSLEQVSRRADAAGEDIVFTPGTMRDRPALNRIPDLVHHSPLVSPEREKAIRSFELALRLMQEAYKVKLSADTDGSGDLIIVDQTRTLPSSYYFDARISQDGELEIAQWIPELEADR